MLRRFELLVVAGVLLLGAFSTGVDFLFFLVYLGLLVLGGAYLISRFGLADLEAGYAIDRTAGHVGETLRATYTLRNAGRLPKLWLEAYTPSTLPVPLPGRAISLGPRSERSWIARVPLTARGHFRVEPLVIRTGDPFGLFEAAASVGSGGGVTVYPRVEPLPRWRLPATALEGTRASRERTIQTTPLVTSIRPYVPGDAFNRIHWKSTARQQEIQVKEFDLEQTADLWLFLDLDGAVQVGSGEESTLEAGVRVAAAMAAHALAENRSVGLTAAGHHLTLLPADRGGRQRAKIMAVLAAVQADGTTPLVEVLLQGLPRLRRGMTAVVVTPSLARDWIRPLGTLHGRGVGAAVCLVDAEAYAEVGRRGGRAIGGRTGAVAGTTSPPGPAPAFATPARDEAARAGRAVRHALAEYDIPLYPIVPHRPLGDLLVTSQTANPVTAR